MRAATRGLSPPRATDLLTASSQLLESDRARNAASRAYASSALPSPIMYVPSFSGSSFSCPLRRAESTSGFGSPWTIPRRDPMSAPSFLSRR